MENSASQRSEVSARSSNSDDGCPEEPLSSEGMRLRTKTLPFPVSAPQHPRDAQGLGQNVPFLVELERERTWRFIATTPLSPAQVNDTEYAVELVDLAKDQEPH